MKKTLLTIAISLAFFINVNAQEIWDDFDSPSKVNYIFTTGSLNRDFSNPKTTGINTSEKCAYYQRNISTPYDVIVIDPAGTRIIDDVSGFLTGSKKITFKIFTNAPIGTKIQITLENKATASPTNYPIGRHSDYIAYTSVTNDWEELVFDYDKQPDPSVSSTTIDRMVILVNPESNTEDLYLFDDLKGPEFIDPCGNITKDYSIVDDFECQRNLNFGFFNGTFLTEANPLKNGINQSERVGYFQKWPGGDGAFGGDLIEPFTTEKYNTAKIQFYATTPALNFFVILQDAGNTTLLEKILVTESTTAWQEYTVDLKAISTSASIAKVVLLLNPGTPTEDFIYLDNFTLFKDGGNGINQLSAVKTSIYPNPTSGLFNIQSNENIASIAIIDNLGRKINAKHATNLASANVDLSGLKSGFYQVIVSYSNGLKSSHRVVKLND
jgi:hypothetical protein